MTSKLKNPEPQWFSCSVSLQNSKTARGCQLPTQGKFSKRPRIHWRLRRHVLADGGYTVMKAEKQKEEEKIRKATWRHNQRSQEGKWDRDGQGYSKQKQGRALKVQVNGWRALNRSRPDRSSLTGNRKLRDNWSTDMGLLVNSWGCIHFTIKDTTRQ